MVGRYQVIADRHLPLFVEVADVVDLVHVDLLGLPGADVYLRLLVVGHVDEQEEVAHVGVGGGVVVLPYLDGK